MNRIYLDPGTLLAPVPPTIVSCGEGQCANLITVAWTGILSSKPPVTYISLRPERYSYGIIREFGEFVINLTDARMARGADVCGMYTGKKRDKASMAGFTLTDSRTVGCKTIEQSPLSLECRVKRIIPLGSHHVFMADIICVTAKEDLIDGDGRLCLDRADLCAYAHGEYYSLGKKLGRFGFSAAGKKHKNKSNVKR